MTKLEKLLNTLLQRGWYPFGRKYNSETGGDHNTISFNYYNNIDEERGLSNYSIRELVSKDSGLWQFVCENRKYGYTIPECWIKNPKICDEGIESVEKECNQNSYEYYIIESALKDESELEQFLLENIKVE